MGCEGGLVLRPRREYIAAEDSSGAAGAELEEDMSAVLLAIFPDYNAASRVRLALFEDGFPTDRIELTACCDPGRAALQPADTPHRQFAKYFGALLTSPDETEVPEHLAQCLDDGAAAVTVHPRGPVETLRATEILARAQPSEVVQHELTDQRYEYAAAKKPKPWITHLWVENHSKAHCIYCRLFEKDLPE
jgi:hypothetical protein